MIYLASVLVFDIFVACIANVLPKKKILTILEIILFVLPLILICGLKSVNVGLDTPGYFASYNESITNSESGLYTGDKGFLLFEFIFKSLKMPYFVFLFVSYSIVFGGAALFAYKKSTNPLLVLLFMTYFGLFGFALSALRQSIAIGLLLIGFAFYDENKPISIISPIVFTVIAAFTHKTAIFGLLVAPLLLVRYSKKTFKYLIVCLLSLTVIAPIIYSGAIVLIKSRYYPSLTGSAWTLLFYVLFCVLTFLLSNEKVIWFLNKKFGKFNSLKFLNAISFNETSEDNEKSLMTTFATYVLYPLLILAIGVYAVIFARIIYFLIPFTAVFIVDLMNNKNINLLTRDILDVLLILFLAGYFVFAILIKDPLSVANYTIGPMF